MSRSHLVRAALSWLGFWLALAGSGASAQSPVPLEAVLSHAEDHAPGLAVARASVAEGGAERSGAGRLLSDPLYVEISGGPRVTDGGAADFDLGISLMQPLELGGERGLRLAAATARGRRREAELEAVRWDVRREIRRAYHRAIVARARVELATRSLELTDRVTEIARRRVESGEIRPLELTLLRADSARARQDLIEALDTLQRERLSIAALAGWSPADPPMPAEPASVLVAVPSIAVLVERASGAHPAIRALEADLVERRARAELADREAVPTLNLGMSLVREGSAGSPANYIGLLVLGAGLPVWDANATERALARVDVHVAEARLAAYRGAIEAHVRRAVGSLQAASERVRIYETEILPELEASIGLVLSAYQSGELDALEVGTASRRLLEAQIVAHDARADYHQARGELESLLGGPMSGTELSATSTSPSP